MLNNHEEMDSFSLLGDQEIADRLESASHIYHGGAICKTDKIGHEKPPHRPDGLVLDVNYGFIPLWAPNVTLRWKFDDRSLLHYRDPESVKNYIRDMIERGLRLWEDAIPVTFFEDTHTCDFKVTVSRHNDCFSNGACVLGEAFFPSGSPNNRLTLFPELFNRSPNTQNEIMAHEFGHIFGLRHFFAKIKEQAWPSEIFGTHSKFTIMNYGKESKMTPKDIEDLKILYTSVWNGTLTHINGTPIRLQVPYTHGYNPYPHSLFPVYRNIAGSISMQEKVKV